MDDITDDLKALNQLMLEAHADTAICHALEAKYKKLVLEKVLDDLGGVHGRLSVKLQALLPPPAAEPQLLQEETYGDDPRWPNVVAHLRRA